MTTLNIDRGQWLTGTARKVLGDSMLRHESGLMCCLGIYCKAEGFTNQQITNKGMPTALVLPDDMRWLRESVQQKDRRPGRHEVASVLAVANDDKKLHQSRREARIAKLFKKYGDIDVQFVGRYADATKVAKAWAKAA